MATEKVFFVKIDIAFEQLVHATSKHKAIQEVKEFFAQDYDIDLTDKEITSVIQQKNDGEKKK